jgi:uncharacterized membrane protein
LARAEPRSIGVGRAPAGHRRDPSALLPWTLIGIAALGMGISAYLTTLHYAGASAVCAQGGVFNCGAVLTSTYSVVPGTPVPVTVPGMVWFLVSAAMAGLALSRRREGREEPRWLRPGHLIWAVLGLGGALYLVHAEVVLGAICEWCTGVHVLVFVSLLLTLARLKPARPLPPDEPG